MPKSIREPKLLRSHDDTSTSMRAAFVLLSLLIIGALMYFNKDRVPTVADAPKTNSITETGTTGSASTR